jgi:hypothetical protein
LQWENHCIKWWLLYMERATTLGRGSQILGQRTSLRSLIGMSLSLEGDYLVMHEYLGI